MAARSRTARDMAQLRDRDPGFLCAYCAVPLALPFPQVGEEHLAWEMDGWELLVPYDGEPSWVPLEGHRFAHRDHVDPVSKGGPDDLDNLVLACEACNIEKGARPLLMFLARRAGLPRFRSVGRPNVPALAHVWAA